jgi:hypothetical protein
VLPDKALLTGAIPQEATGRVVQAEEPQPEIQIEQERQIKQST